LELPKPTAEVAEVTVGVEVMGEVSELTAEASGAGVFMAAVLAAASLAAGSAFMATGF
jgi:hypothetical protein